MLTERLVDHDAPLDRLRCAERSLRRRRWRVGNYWAVEPPVAADLVGTAVQYQMWHALALVGVAWLSDDPWVPDGVVGVAGGCFLLGILLFCGTLCATTAEGVPLFPLSAPAGSFLLVAGWIGLGAAGLMPR